MSHLELTQSTVAYSFRQPWLYLMLNLPVEFRKDFENRTQRNGTLSSCPIWLHASKITRGDYELALRVAQRAGVPSYLIPEYTSPRYAQGAVLGLGKFGAPVWCENDNRWIMAGHWAYPVELVRSFNPVAAKGALSTWKVSPELLGKLRVNYYAANPR